MSVHDVLALALSDAVSAGLIVPCVGRADRWTSDDLDELQEAAVDCDGCPVMAECAVAGRTAVWGVWGGQVRWPSSHKRKVARAS